MTRHFALPALLLSAGLAAAEEPKTTADFPPGWVPVTTLDGEPTWKEVRAIEDKIHLYLPPGVKTVRGVFVCYVFHSQDPRELADLWGFALVTVPWPFEYDLGVNDKRNGRFKLGHPVGHTGTLLKYLEVAAKETKHPVLAVAPLAGWLGQNGSHLGNDLWERAPDRVIAWSDSFQNRLEKYPKLTAAVPFPFAWEVTAKEEKERQEAYLTKHAELKDKLTPPPDFKARANTYGFPHGIYSKYSYFVAYLDRCIKHRLPAETPNPGEPTKLNPWVLADGWAGDFAPVGEWNLIAPANAAKGMVAPQWFPDEYAACVWRAYHTAHPDVAITGPVMAYKKGGDPVNGGSGYSPLAKAGDAHSLTAEGKGEYAKVEFYAGNKLLGTSDKAPWKVDGVKVDRGLDALIAVGVTKDGTRTSSRPAFLAVK